MEKQRKNNASFKKGNKLGNRFSKENQPTPEEKKEGWAKRNLREELIERLAEKLFEVKAPDIAVENSVMDAQKGNVKNLIDLLKIIKMPDKFTVDSKFDVKQLVLEVVEDGTGADENEDASEISSFNN